jgi:hypothetical protein
MYHFSVGEPQPAQPATRQNPVSLNIISGKFGMNCAIHLNDQSGRVTAEINDEAINDLLPPEPQPTESIGPQQAPERRLTSSHVLPELP